MRINGEIKRRTGVVGIFPNDDAIVRLVGALFLEQNDEWAVQRARYMTLETIAPLSDAASRGALISPANAGEHGDQRRKLHHAKGHDPGLTIDLISPCNGAISNYRRLGTNGGVQDDSGRSNQARR